MTTGLVSDLGPASRQLADVAHVLESLSKLERRLHEAGATASFGGLDVLIEARGSIQSVVKHSEELGKGRLSADKQLARAIYARFIQGFLANTEAEVSKAKTSASKLTDALDTITSCRQRLADVVVGDTARFTELEPSAITLLIQRIVEEHSPTPSETPATHRAGPGSH